MIDDLSATAGAAREAEYGLIHSDYGLIPWLEEYGWIRNKARKIVAPIANPYQIRCAEAISYCLSHEIPIRLIKLKPRQKGSSTISMAELYWLSRLFPINSRIIGGQYDQVANLWEILKLYHERDYFPWDSTGVINSRNAAWSNGSACAWETAGDSEAGRSGTFQAIVATEAARWREEGVAAATDVITGILNCVPDLPQTMVILESTAAGDYGMFFDYWQDACDLDSVIAGNTPRDWNGYIRIFSPWFEHSDSCDNLTEVEEGRVRASYTDVERSMVSTHQLSPGHISWYRRTMRSECKRDPSIMMREYPGTPEEAFNAASKRRFNSAGLAILEAQARQATADSGYFQREDHEDGTPPTYTFLSCPADDATVFIETAPVVGHRYLLSIDIATGASQVTGDDPDRHSVGVLRDGFVHPSRGWQPPRLVAWTPEICLWDIDILIDVSYALSRYYGDCLIIPEANMDRGLILGLKALGANLYERTKDDEMPAGARSPKKTGKYGVVTTGGQAENTRNWMLEQLARRIREWDTVGDGIAVPDLATVRELKSFIVRKNGRAEAADGKHDDRVLQLAIGVSFLPMATRYEARRGPRIIPRELRKDFDEDGDGFTQYS